MDDDDDDGDDVVLMIVTRRDGTCTYCILLLTYLGLITLLLLNNFVSFTFM